MFRDQPKVFNQELIDALSREANEIPVQIQRQEEEKKEYLRLIAQFKLSIQQEEKNEAILDDRISALRKDLSTRINNLSAVKRDIATADKRVSSIAQRISSRQERIVAIRASIPALNESMTSVRTKIASLDYNAPALNGRISSVRSNISSVRNSNSITTSELSTTRNRIATVTDRLSTIRRELPSLRVQISAIHDRVSSARSSLLAAQSRVTTHSLSLGYGGASYQSQNLSGNVVSSSFGVRQTHLGGMQGQQLGGPGYYGAPRGGIQIHTHIDEFEFSRLRRELDAAIHDQETLIPRFERKISEFNEEQMEQQKQLAVYESRVSALISEQSEQQVKIHAYQNEISDLEQKLDRVQAYERDILRLSAELSLALDSEKEIPTYEAEILKWREELASAKNDQETLMPTYEKESERLNSEIAELREAEAKLLRERRVHEEEIERIESLIQERERQLRALDLKAQEQHKREEVLQVELAEVRQFMGTLRAQPQLLYQEVTVPLLANLEAYEKQHPHNQSVAVRLCLAQLANKINFIQNLNLDAQLEGGAANPQLSWQVKFALLNGLLWHSLQQLSGRRDREVASMLHSALLSMHIAENGNLPNELALRQDCLSLYRGLQQTHSQDLRELAENELVFFSRKQFNKAVADLRGILAKIPRNHQALAELVVKGEAVAKFYTDQADLLTQNGAIDHDLSGFTELIQQTAALAKTPSNSYLRLKYKEAAEKAEGHPSFGKKLGGVLLAFLGAVIVAASVFALFSSFGASTPLSTVSATIGTSLLAKGLSVAGTVVGLGTLAGGHGLFNSGRRKAESKVRMEFVKAALINNVDPLLEEGPKPAADNQLPPSAPPPYQPSAPLYPQINQAYVPPPGTNPWYPGDEGQEFAAKKCGF